MHEKLRFIIRLRLAEFNIKPQKSSLFETLSCCPIKLKYAPIAIK